MKKINLFWCKNEKGHGNFGDELNPYIVSALTGNKPQFLDVMKLPKNNIHFIKSTFKHLLKVEFSKLFKKEHWSSIFDQKVIVAIGSVIGWYHTPNIIVWGAGILNKDTKVYNADFRAVRGKYTLNRLKELGYNTVNTVMGDPGLLLPLILPNQNVTKQFKVGIIPHYMHYEKVKDNINNTDVIIINLLEPVDKILEEIMNCEFVLSTSLHGVIVSHAYEIPCLWVDFDSLDLTTLYGDNVKFADYFSSLNIEEYKSIPISLPLDTDKIKKIQFKYDNISLPNQANLLKVQKDLINNAPFKIRDVILDKMCGLMNNDK